MYHPPTTTTHHYQHIINQSPSTNQTFAVAFAGEALQELLNLILNKGVVGSCGKLCAALVKATGNSKLGGPCNLLCDIVGIKDFIKWIQNADLSPYYDCIELGVCKTNDNGDATITSWLATPSELAAGPSKKQTHQFIGPELARGH